MSLSRGGDVPTTEDDGHLAAALSPSVSQEEVSRAQSEFELSEEHVEASTLAPSGTSPKIDANACPEEQADETQHVPPPLSTAESLPQSAPTRPECELGEEELMQASSCMPIVGEIATQAVEEVAEEAGLCPLEPQEELLGACLESGLCEQEFEEQTPEPSAMSSGSDVDAQVAGEAAVTVAAEVVQEPAPPSPMDSQQEFSKDCSEVELKEEELRDCLPEFLETSLDSAADAQAGNEAEADADWHVSATSSPIESRQEFIREWPELEPEEEYLGEHMPENLGMLLNSDEHAREVEHVRRWLQSSFWLARYFGAFREQGYDNLAALRTAEVDEVNDLIASCGMPRVHAQLFQIELQQLRFAEQQVAVASSDQDGQLQELSNTAMPSRSESADSVVFHDGELQAGVEAAAQQALRHVRRSEVTAFLELWQWLHSRQLSRYAGGLAQHGFTSLAGLASAGRQALQDLAPRCGIPPGHARFLLRELGWAQRPLGEISQADVQELAGTVCWSYTPKVEAAA